MRQNILESARTELYKTRPKLHPCQISSLWRPSSMLNFRTRRFLPWINRWTRSSVTSTDNISAMLSQNAENFKESALHHAAIALGSNMGDKVGHIEQALAMMSQNNIRVLSVSALYETKAMYYENQDSFINGACYVETDLRPLRLLDKLQEIENRSGRVRTIDKGPRTLDLDIILYDEEHILNERLEVPHKLLLEREFVLRPLADILPQYTFPISFSSTEATPRSVATALQHVQNSDTPMYPVTILASQLPPVHAMEPTRSTRIMSILNITPDSFSDGGTYSEKNLEALKSDVRKHIAAGATILDIGGQSTRPNADLLTASEESQRVLPVVEAIRSIPEANDVAISIDTFYSEVARESVRYGADIINDISGGLLDPNMLSTVAELGKTIVLMHMRGNPQTMNKLTDYPDGVTEGVARELSERVKQARAAGIQPWRIVLDPGIGFAKTQDQNLRLLKDLPVLRAHSEFSGLPWLLGVSRKGFIGKITGVQNAGQRTWGTAAAITSSIAGGADIVRVHDVAEMALVSKMADAIYRR